MSEDNKGLDTVDLPEVPAPALLPEHDQIDTDQIDTGQIGAAEGAPSADGTCRCGEVGGSVVGVGTTNEEVCAFYEGRELRRKVGLVDEETLAAALGVKAITLKGWRSEARSDRPSIPYVRIGKRVFYRVADVEAWVTSLEATF